ncbi:uncharacterized protein METZ01_LOCUS233011, partial [marine metagenome]
VADREPAVQVDKWATARAVAAKLTTIAV